MEAPTVQERLRQALGKAVKARDMVAVSALRSALGAIDNATAVPAAPAAPATTASSPHFAGAVAGLGAAETERRGLTEDDAMAIVRAEASERRTAAADYERLGHPDRAGRLRHEADILANALQPTPTSTPTSTPTPTPMPTSAPTPAPTSAPAL